MKNARPQKTGTSANDKRDFTPGSLPIRRDSVIAATLASMLEGKALTGLDAVNAQNTTQLKCGDI